MSRFKNLSSGAWVVVGLLIALVVAPAMAAAATITVVRIKGPSGNSADVTANQQLLTTEAKPASYQIGTATVQGDPVAICKPLLAPSGGNALVVDEIRLGEFEVPPNAPQTNGSQQQLGYFLLTADPVGAANCGTVNVVGASTPSEPGDVTIPLPPGYAIPPGYVLDLSVSQYAGAIASAYGYSVPAADVGATPSSSGRASTGRSSTGAALIVPGR